MKTNYHLLAIIGLTISIGLISQEIKGLTSALIIGATIYTTYKAIKNHECTSSN